MSMLLKSDDGSEFELAIIEDASLEHEERQGGLDPAGEDLPWVTISFRVATPETSWEETSPSLNPQQVTTLLEFLDAIATGEPELGEIELLDPELRFSVVGDSGSDVTLRIGFHLEDRPEEYNVDADTDAHHVDIKLSREQVAAAAMALRRDLESAAHSDEAGAPLDEVEGREAIPGDEQLPGAEGDEEEAVTGDDDHDGRVW
ncbi:MAG TPA: hypothetical protein VD963_01835 [Phycisphaerales bacterium]|nr:hypothetical protein [Phycisphaerales bacterium]